MKEAVEFTFPKADYAEAVTKVVVSFKPDRFTFHAEACELELDNFWLSVLHI